MARYLGPKCRLCRREGERLYLKGSRCHTAKCAVSKRAYVPGMHAFRRSRMSEYGARLREKQKTKRIYGVLERQFHKYFSEAERLRGKAELRLSRRATQVGHFYWKRKAWQAAERRYRLAYDEFPNSKLASLCRYRQAVCLWQLGRMDEARLALEGLVASDPDSRSATRARRFLEKRGAAENKLQDAPAESSETPAGQ